METIRNKIIRGTAQVEQLGDKVREASLRCLDMCRGGTEGILVEG